MIRSNNLPIREINYLNKGFHISNCPCPNIEFSIHSWIQWKLDSSYEYRNIVAPRKSIKISRGELEAKMGTNCTDLSKRKKRESKKTNTREKCTKIIWWWKMIHFKKWRKREYKQRYRRDSERRSKNMIRNSGPFNPRRFRCWNG